jgi:hypothetical protein
MPDAQVNVIQEKTDRSEQVTNQIRIRAYQLFEARGCEHGHDVEDWCEAEHEVLYALEKDEENHPPVSKSTIEVPSKSVAA